VNTGKYDRNAKMKQKVLDDVDIFIAKKFTQSTTVSMNPNPPQMGQEWRELEYWDSPGKRIKIFNLTQGKLEKQCLCDRDKLLQKHH
jgi:hypothetical protein